MAANTNNVCVTSYSATNVTTSAYVTLIASTAIPCSKIEILDTSTKILKLAVGAAGSEVDLCSVPLSASLVIPVGYIPAGSRISIKAIDATASSGYNILSLLKG